MAHSVLFDLAKLPPGALVGVDADGNYRVVKVNNSGAIETTASIDGDVTIGAITIDNTDENPVPVSGPLTDTQLRASDVKVTLDSEAVVLGAGTDTIGKLGANSGVDIGDVDVTSLPSLPAGSNLIGKVGSDTTGTATLSNVAASATSTAILPANATRKRVVIVNDSTATLYLKFGATASATSFTYLLYGGDTYESPSNPIYTGQIDGIWASATGAARVTEFV